MKKLLIISISLSLFYNIAAQDNLFIGNKVLYDETSALLYNCSVSDNGELLFVHSIGEMPDGSSVSKVTLGPDNNSRENTIKKMWSNFNVFGDYNFDIVVNNQHLSSNSHFYRPSTNQYYYFECRRKDTGILDNASIYWPGDNLLKISNYEFIADKEKPLFNYDFIVEKESIYLLIQPTNCIYIYQINDVSELPNPDWNLLHCIESPFDNEYFIVTKTIVKNQSSYIVHTQSQGEYALFDFLTEPRIVKINDNNLRNRIFIEDKRTDTFYQITKDECNSLIRSNGDPKRLDSIISNINK
jgi:hypothetical protein